MATARYSFDAFDANAETFDSYLERLQAYFQAMDIGQCNPDATAEVRAAADKKKTSHLISCVGRFTYGILRDLCSPNKPSDKTFDELCVLLANHFKPKKLEIAETYRFHQCVQQQDETISIYSARLRRMAATCNFGDNLNRALRDQFVAGVRSADTRRKLLGKDNSFDDVMKIALADEVAAKEVSHVGASSVRSVNYVKPGISTHFAGKSSKSHSFVKKGKSNVNMQCEVQKNKYVNDKSVTMSSAYVCRSCGKGNHKRSDCKFRDAVCRVCSKKGHISYVCHFRSVQGGVHQVEVNEPPADDELDIPDFLFSLEDEVSDNTDVYYETYSPLKSNNVVEVPVTVEGYAVNFQLDTGCGMSVVSKDFYDANLSHLRLQKTNVILQTYTKEIVKPLGVVEVEVIYEQTCYKLPLLVIQSGACPLFGRNWLQLIKLNWPAIMAKIQAVHAIKPMQNSNTTVGEVVNENIDTLLNKFSELFDNTTIGCYTGEPVQLTVNKMPSFHKARPVPYALQEKVEKALNNMEKEGVIERVSTAPCAAPIVVVGKKDSDKVRICGDFSVTYNCCADLVRYPLPKIEDLHAAMNGCKVFSCIDIRDAYHNVKISEESQKYLIINTHIGLFAFKRLPNGVHSGPALFQQIMDTVLAGIPKVICILDDILCGGFDVQDQLNTLSVVLCRLQSAGFKLNKAKCKFLKSSVTYLGHVIDAEGLHPTDTKLKAIRDAPAPRNVVELRAYLGLLMFYSRFLPNHSSVLAPLNALLKSDVPWRWSQEENNAFKASKKLLCESKILVHYDSNKPLYLSCDASQSGAGAALCHYIDGNYRPVAFASCTLSDCQKNYSQLEKEAFSIIFGLKRFHQFLAGRAFTIITDHRPLLSLLAPDKSAPMHTAARLQRWSLILSSYKYKLQYRRTTEHFDADCLSRLPLPEMWNPKSENVECYFMDTDVDSTLTCTQISQATRVDPVLSRVYSFVINGWPQAVTDPDIRPYKERQDQLTVEQGCVLWGMRVIVPEVLRTKVLDEIHETHPGMSRMKAIARSFVWWPQLDKQIEDKVASCTVCQAMKSAPPAAQVHPWCYPSRPWSRIHVDYAGPVNGFMYLVVVCAYSKYPEIVKMTSTTTTATIDVLRQIFSRHGLCETLVSDNGPQFVSQEFELFCANNGIVHKTSAIYKPSTNGQAERVVRLLKTAIKQAQLMHVNVDTMIAKYLLVYRTTPHATTGEAPSVLLMGRRLRTRYDLMVPSVTAHVQRKQLTMQAKMESRGSRQFAVNDSVLVRNFCGMNKWEPGVVIEKLGNRYYMILVNGTVVKRHVDQIIARRKLDNQSQFSGSDHEYSNSSNLAMDSADSTEDTSSEVNLPITTTEVTSNSSRITEHSSSTTDTKTVDPNADIPVTVDNQTTKKTSVEPPDTVVTSTQKRYPSRFRKQPRYLSDYVQK